LAVTHSSSTLQDVIAGLTASLHRSRRHDVPYPHWLPEHCLPEDIADALNALPIAPARIGETQGRRETHNASRVYFNEDNRRRYAVMDILARAFQSRELVDAVQTHTDARLSGSSLRLEYCQDTDGFWLEPHTDIGVKKFTMLIYLNREPEARDWGTDLYTGPDTHMGRAPAKFNSGLIFVPGDNTWHGFEKRPIKGVRKCLIVNYVGPEWRSRHELCFSGDPVH
jgi:hypothetical protein